MHKFTDLTNFFQFCSLTLESLSEKINVINTQVSTKCQNFDDVIRYVDENMKDSKLCYLTLYSQIN